MLLILGVAVGDHVLLPLVHNQLLLKLLLLYHCCPVDVLSLDLLA